MSKFWKKWIPTIFVAVPLTTLPLSSCTTQYNQTPSVQNNNIVVYSKEFSFPVTFSAPITNHEVAAHIVNNTSSSISLKNNLMQVHNNQINATFLIDETVDTDFSANFDICFNYINSEGKFDTCTLYDLNIYYLTSQPEFEKDRIVFDDKHLVANNHHSVSFEMKFFEKPKSDLYVEILNDFSKEISLPKSMLQVEEDGAGWSLSIPIDIDMAVATQRDFGFDLRITFTNSFGKTQTNTYNNCTIKFIRQVNEYLPDEYYDYEAIGDNVVLHGLKYLNPLEAGKYRFMTIPDIVTHIDPYAFSSSTWFSNIRQVTLPASAQNIGQFAFSGLSQLVEIDASAYTETPLWVATSDVLKRPNQTVNAGYVWVQNDDIANDMTNAASFLGLTELWRVYNQDLVTKKDYFDISNEGTMVRGIRADRKEEFFKCKIIRIPDGINQIYKDAFKELQDNPYSTYIEGVKVKQTRRLILNRELTKIDNGAFSHAGISGPMLFYTEKLNTISDNSFDQCNAYGNPKLLDIQEEKIELIFVDVFELTEIGAYAFNMVPIKQEVLDLPKSLSSVDSFAFLDSYFEKIIFHQNVQTMTSYCFASGQIWPKPATIKVIDLSEYKKLAGWWSQSSRVFMNSCVGDVKVILNNKIKSEFDEKIKEDQFKKNLMLPDTAQLSWID